MGIGSRRAWTGSGAVLCGCTPCLARALRTVGLEMPSHRAIVPSSYRPTARGSNRRRRASLFGLELWRATAGFRGRPKIGVLCAPFVGIEHWQLSHTVVGHPRWMEAASPRAIGDVLNGQAELPARAVPADGLSVALHRSTRTPVLILPESGMLPAPPLGGAAFLVA